jgi:antitoxin YqcF
MTKQISDENKQIARTLAALFGGTPKVTQYLDRDEKAEIAILSSTDRPEEGLISFGTVGLSDYPIPGTLRPPLGVEIAAISDLPEFAAVLSTAAFCVINSGWQAEPGRVFPDVVAAHLPDTTVPHLMFVTPYSWDDLPSRALTGKTVAWVQAIAISDAEMHFVRDHGAEGLEELFEDAQPDFLDLERPSTV